VPLGESNEYGSAEKSDGGIVIKTVVTGGASEVELNADPGIRDEIWWFVETSVPMPAFAGIGVSLAILPPVYLRGRESRMKRLTAFLSGRGINTRDSS